MEDVEDGGVDGMVVVQGQGWSLRLCLLTLVCYVCDRWQTRAPGVKLPKKERKIGVVADGLGEPKSVDPVAVAALVWPQNTNYIFRHDIQNLIWAPNKLEKSGTNQNKLCWLGSKAYVFCQHWNDRGNAHLRTLKPVWYLWSTQDKLQKLQIKLNCTPIYSISLAQIFRVHVWSHTR